MKIYKCILISIIVCGCDATQQVVSTTSNATPALMDNGVTSWTWERRLRQYDSSWGGRYSTWFETNHQSSFSIIHISLVKRISSEQARQGYSQGLAVSVVESTWNSGIKTSYFHTWSDTSNSPVSQSINDTTLLIKQYQDTIFLNPENKTSSAREIPPGIILNQWALPTFKDSIQSNLCGDNVSYGPANIDCKTPIIPNNDDFEKFNSMIIRNGTTVQYQKSTWNAENNVGIRNWYHVSINQYQPNFTSTNFSFYTDSILLRAWTPAK